MNQLNSSKQSFWYGVAAGTPALMALVTIATKAGTAYLSSEWFLCFMFVLSVPALLLTSVTTKKAVGREFNEAFAGEVTRKGWLSFFGHTLCIGLAWFFYIRGIELLPAAVAVFVSRIEGVFIIVLAVVLLRESLNRTLFLAIFFAFAGLVCIDQSELRETTLAVSRTGILFIVLGAVFFAFGEIFARKTLHWFSPDLFALLRNMLLSPAFLFIALAKANAVVWAGDWLFWVIIAALAGPVGARLLYLNCIRHIPVSHAAVMTNTEPVFGAFLGLLVFKEWPNAAEVTGAGLITAGVLIGFFGKKPTQGDSPENPASKPLTGEA